MVIAAEDALYPQNNRAVTVAGMMVEAWGPWLREQAKKRLESMKSPHDAHPDVVRHWKKLAQDGEGQAV